MEFIKFFLIASLASVILGQLIRLPIASGLGALTITDILVAITCFVFVSYSLLIKKSFKVPVKIFFPATLFILAAVSSTILATNTFSLNEILISSLFLVRFIIYFLITVIVYNIVEKNQITGWVNSFLLIGLIFLTIGLIQLIVFPDLSFLTAAGWDPHQKRIVSSLLDPNFTGLVSTIIFAYAISLYLYEKKGLYFLLSLLSFIGVILTYSRSSYLAMLVVLAIIGFSKSPRVLVVALVSFLIAFLVSSQVRLRVVGALTLDETAQARIVSWQKALTIFGNNPVFGVGFNTYRFAQVKYGFLPIGDLGGHSGAGSDSSFLTVAATTGIVGSLFYIFLLIAIWQALKVETGSGFLHLASLASFLGLFVHSQFVNSLFFPQIMLILWFMLGLILVANQPSVRH